jgi:hypothetical protein
MTDFIERVEGLPAAREQTLVEFFRSSPLAEAELDFEREPDYGRDISI